MEDVDGEFDLDAAPDIAAPGPGPAMEEDEDEDEDEENTPVINGAKMSMTRTPATIVDEVVPKTRSASASRVPRPKPAAQSPADREAAERARGNEFFGAGEFAKAAKCYTACLGISNR